MTRARDLADSADKDIAGTLTLDDLTVDNNVGIGTSSPSAKLDLQGTAAGDEMLEITHSGASQPWKFISGESGVTNESLRISRGASGEWMRFHAGLGTVFYHDGSERMRIDSAGRVTMPYQPAFRVGRSTGISGQQVVTFDTIYTNVGGHYNSSNGRFTAPVAGVYYFAWQGISGSASTSNEQNVNLAVNNSAIHDSRFRGYIESGGHVITVVYLSVGDYVNVYIGNPNTSLYPSAFHNQFMGYLLG